MKDGRKTGLTVEDASWCPILFLCSREGHHWRYPCQPILCQRVEMFSWVWWQVIYCWKHSQMDFHTVSLCTMVLCDRRTEKRGMTTKQSNVGARIYRASKHNLSLPSLWTCQGTPAWPSLHQNCSEVEPGPWICSRLWGYLYDRSIKWCVVSQKEP